MNKVSIDKFYINESCDAGYSPFTILLDDTDQLNSIADDIQKEKWELPLFDTSGEYDPDDWYDFFLECDLDGVHGMYFQYGNCPDYCDSIELDDESKRKAYEAVLKFFGGIDGYKEYIEIYG